MDEESSANSIVDELRKEIARKEEDPSWLRTQATYRIQDANEQNKIAKELEEKATTIEVKEGVRQKRAEMNRTYAESVKNEVKSGRQVLNRLQADISTMQQSDSPIVRETGRFLQEASEQMEQAVVGGEERMDDPSLEDYLQFNRAKIVTQEPLEEACRGRSGGIVLESTLTGVARLNALRDGSYLLQTSMVSENPKPYKDWVEEHATGQVESMAVSRLVMEHTGEEWKVFALAQVDNQGHTVFERIPKELPKEIVEDIGKNLQGKTIRKG